MLNRDKILDYLKKEGKPVYETQIFSDLNIDAETTKLFYDLINTLEYTGQIIKTKKNKYALPEKMGLTLGKMITTPKGFGFVRQEGKGREQDIFIPMNEMKTAMEGDLVYCKVIEKAKGNNKREGTIVKIIKRANNTIVGTFEKCKGYGFLIPDNSAIFKDVFIKKQDFNGAKNRDKVVVRIRKWGFDRSLPEGEIVEVMGDLKQKGVDVLSIIRKYKLPEAFNKKVTKEADAVPKEVLESELKGRVDFRNKAIITIDGADSKDLDDAIGLEKDSNGNYLLGVHIADVTHYVKRGSKLDKEALKRGNSVYLINKVLPMLPKNLSNGICSLNEGVNRLTLSVEMTINKEGELINSKISEGVIKTRHRLNYDEVSEILDSGKIDPKCKIDKDVQEMLFEMQELSNILAKKREDNGALNFNFVEAYIELDDDGKPINIKPRNRGSSDKIIEQFMIKANEAVAKYSVDKKLPFVYRVHETPDLERLDALNRYIKPLGYNIKIDREGEVKPKDLQEVLKKLEGTHEEKIVSKMLLRSLKQARYSPKCLGHIGLASEYYCHFTSPIRRYADLQIHRILKADMHGELKGEVVDELNHRMEIVSEQTSDTERVAESAEREVDKMKMCQYMEDKVGAEFDATIGSITKFGIYSELDNTVEGFTKVSLLEDDYYIFDENTLSFVGDKTGKVYSIGDKVKIKVDKVDIEKRKIDFLII